MERPQEREVRVRQLAPAAEFVLVSTNLKAQKRFI
jgi:hypothetical protein